MRLISCYIENFGKLHRASFSFDRELTVFCEENGWGKSTLAAFLRAMFYGLAGDRRRSTSENERKFYAPWQGGAFGGSLTFETEGKTYTVTRIFREKESKDTFELLDAETNLPSTDFSAHLGEELFGIDRESFLNTLFIGQEQCHAAATDDIHAKIGNLAEDAGDLNSYEDAMARLDGAISALNPNRATGSLARRKKEMGILQRSIDDGASAAEELREAQARLAQEETSYQEMDLRYRRILEFQAKTAAEQQHQVSELQRRAEEEKRQSRSSHSAPRESRPEQEADRIRRVTGILPGSIALLLGIILQFVWRQTLPAAIGIALGIALLFYARLQNRKYGRREENSEENFKAADADDIAHDEGRCDEASETDSIPEEDLSARLLQLNQELRSCVHKRDILRERMAGCRREIESLQQRYDAREEDLQRMAQLEEAQEAEQHRYRCLVKARDAMAKARQRLTAKYADPILRSFVRYYTQIAQEDADGFHINANTEVTVDELGMQRPEITFSQGSRDLMGFCLRIALIDAMYPGMRPMLILDDPFVNLDDHRLEKARELLREISEEYQVIYFTCSQARCP